MVYILYLLEIRYMRIKNLVSIVIPTHNRKESVVRLLKQIINNDYKKLEIIVVDDASSDGTYEFIQSEIKDPRLKIIQNKKNLFAAASKNVGAEKAQGEFIFFIDDDNVVSNHLISNLVKVISSDEKIGEVGPVMYFYSKKNKIFWAGTNRNMLTSKTNFRLNFKNLSNTKVWDTDDVLNAYMVRSSVVKNHKIKFKDKLGIMYEESDYAYRIRKLGYLVKVVRDAKIYHDVEDWSGKKNKTAFLYHTMKDIRRPYYTARNRLIFHTLYSNKLQLLGIVLFWNWLFAGFYLSQIISYSGPGEFTFLDRVKLSISYIRGILDGIRFMFTKHYELI